MWKTNEMPALTGKTAIVTGSNSGIGFESAKAIALKGAHVVMAVRNLEKGNAAMERIRQQVKDASIEVMQLDLANLASVKSFAQAFKKSHKQLDLLINNAGVMVPPKRMETEDGFELQFGTNHLGHFALTGQLLDLILKTPGSRIVNVSSTAHWMGKMDFENINADKSYVKWVAYGNSKVSNLLFTRELQRRLEAAGKETIVLAAHPGWTATELQRYTGSTRFMNKFLAMKPWQGALPTLYAATVAPNGHDFFGPDGFMEMRGYPKPARSSSLSNDAEVAKKLWDLSEKLTGVSFSFA